MPFWVAWLCRPIVRVEFHTFSDDQLRQLHCYITHPHIERRWIQALGLTRQPIARAVIGLTVTNTETGKYVIPPSILPLGTRWEPNDLGEQLNIAEWKKETGNVIVGAPGVLPNGTYRCDIEIKGSVRLNKSATFVAASGELRWLP